MMETKCRHRTEEEGPKKKERRRRNEEEGTKKKERNDETRQATI
jgi:hypothetical protein